MVKEAPIILIIDLWQWDANYYIHIEEIERVCSKWGLERVTDL